MTNSLALTEEHKRLHNLRNALRNRYTSLQLKRDSMLHTESPNLQALYLSRIGYLQYDLFAVETDIARLKMEAKLIQGYINRNKAIDFGAVQEELEEATETFREQLEEQQAKIQAAHEYLAAPHLDVKEHAEFKRLYRDIVKRLHPDLNDHLTDEEKRLFVEAQDAYRWGDLEMMRALHEQVTSMEIAVPVSSDLADEVSRLRKLVDELSEKLRKLREEFPFNQRELLEDEHKIAERQAELHKQIADKKQEREEYQQYVNALRLWKPGLSN